MMNEYSHSSRGPVLHRERIVRPAIIYSVATAVFGVVVLVAIYHVMMGDFGYVIMLCVVGLFGFLTGFQAQQYLRDLSAAPVVLEGEVLRKWNKGNLFLFLMPSYYIYVADRDQ